MPIFPKTLIRIGFRYALIRGWPTQLLRRVINKYSSGHFLNCPPLFRKCIRWRVRVKPKHVNCCVKTDRLGLQNLTGWREDTRTEEIINWLLIWLTAPEVTRTWGIIIEGPKTKPLLQTWAELCNGLGPPQRNRGIRQERLWVRLYDVLIPSPIAIFSAAYLILANPNEGTAHTDEIRALIQNLKDIRVIITPDIMFETHLVGVGGPFFSVSLALRWRFATLDGEAMTLLAKGRNADLPAELAWSISDMSSSSSRLPVRSAW